MQASSTVLLMFREVLDVFDHIPAYLPKLVFIKYIPREIRSQISTDWLYANFFCYTNFSIDLGPNFKGAKVSEEGKLPQRVTPHRGRQPADENVLEKIADTYVPCEPCIDKNASLVLGPPVSHCTECDDELYVIWNDQKVKFYTLDDDIMEKQKVTMRCRSCDIYFHYKLYGSKAKECRFYPSGCCQAIQAASGKLIDRN